MTEKQAYENVLRELRKAKAPSLHLEDYNYWMTKGILEYANERYNLFAVNQQLSDDLQPLVVSTTFTITPGLAGTFTGAYTGSYTQVGVPVSTGNRYGSAYFQFNSPINYWHFLGAHVAAATRRPYKCHARGFVVNKPSKRLTDDVANGIINNSFLKPSFERVYHKFVDGTNNSVKPDLMFLYGSAAQFTLNSINVDYLKEPRAVNLTVQQVNLPLDTSATLEWPEYICNEIIKRVVKLILEASSDPRLQTKVMVDKTIP